MNRGIKPSHYHAATLGKLFTYMFLCYQTDQVSKCIGLASCQFTFTRWRHHAVLLTTCHGTYSYVLVKFSMYSLPLFCCYSSICDHLSWKCLLIVPGVLLQISGNFNCVSLMEQTLGLQLSKVTEKSYVGEEWHKIAPTWVSVNAYISETSLDITLKFCECPFE